MAAGNPTRDRILVALLIALSCASSAKLLVEVAGQTTQPQSLDVERFTSRFETLRHDLPHNSVVGYLSDLPEYSELYNLTAYALAPVVVANSLAPNIVIGNFQRPQTAADFQARGFELVRDYGEGVYLLRKARP